MKQLCEVHDVDPTQVGTDCVACHVISFWKPIAQITSEERQRLTKIIYEIEELLKNENN